MGVIAAFRDAVVDFGFFDLATEIRSIARRFRIRGSQEDLGAEGLQQRLIPLARHGLFQRIDALASHNGDALGLPGKTQKPVIAVGIVASNGGEVLILVAEKYGGSEVLILA